MYNLQSTNTGDVACDGKQRFEQLKTQNSPNSSVWTLEYYSWNPQCFQMNKLNKFVSLKVTSKN